MGTEAGNRQLYLRRLDEFEAHYVRGMEGATAIFFSPTGDSLVAISTDRSMKKASLEDGLVVPIASDVDYTTGGAWGTDDLITFGRGGVLWQVPASGGKATQLTTLDVNRGELLHAFPASVADGKGILFTTVTGPGRGAAHIEALAVPANSAGRRRIINSATSPAYLQSGHLIFFRDGTLLVTGFDEKRLEVTSAAVKTIEQIGATPSGAPMWAVSRSGAVAYSTGAGSRLVWVSRDGSEQPLSAAGRQVHVSRGSLRAADKSSCPPEGISGFRIRRARHSQNSRRSPRVGTPTRSGRQTSTASSSGPTRACSGWQRTAAVAHRRFLGPP